LALRRTKAAVPGYPRRRHLRVSARATLPLFHVRANRLHQRRKLGAPRGLASHMSRCGRPGVLLDRDGTIIVDHGYVGSIDRVEFIDGAPEAIAEINRAGVPVAVVTNQAGVAKGLYGIDDVEAVHTHISRVLAECGANIDLFLFCPYHPEGAVDEYRRDTSSRKPGPGMAMAAAEALNLDLSRSWVVGDSFADVGLADAVGATAVYVGEEPAEYDHVCSFPSLAAAVPFILERIAA
jgi:D,D-heptose 1,7-bisphosphate phosphatase